MVVLRVLQDNLVSSNELIVLISNLSIAHCYFVLLFTSLLLT